MSGPTSPDGLTQFGRRPRTRSAAAGTEPLRVGAGLGVDLSLCFLIRMLPEQLPDQRPVARVRLGTSVRWSVALGFLYVYQV
jgi:hypothetical protein